MYPCLCVRVCACARARPPDEENGQGADRRIRRKKKKKKKRKKKERKKKKSRKRSRGEFYLDTSPFHHRNVPKKLAPPYQRSFRGDDRDASTGFSTRETRYPVCLPLSAPRNTPLRGWLVGGGGLGRPRSGGVPWLPSTEGAVWFPCV